MTKLRCSAVHCEYNSDQYCCRPDVQIGGGDQAKSSCQTCCDSFRERNASTTNSANFTRVNPNLQIACNATCCHYNCMGTCSAKDVKISGVGAHKQCDTACETFTTHKNKSC